MLQRSDWGDLTAPDPTELPQLPAELLVANDTPRLTPADVCTLLMVLVAVCAPSIPLVALVWPLFR